MEFKNIIFVCAENTCRSIMAEAIMKRILLEEISVISRGLVVLFPEPVNAKAVMVLEERGGTLPKTEAEPLTAEDIDEKSLIITMTEQEKQKVLMAYSDANFIYTIRELAGEQGNIEEPVGELAEYSSCYSHIRRLLERIAVTL